MAQYYQLEKVETPSAGLEKKKKRPKYFLYKR